MLGVIFELLVVEKDLFARREDELGAAISAFQYSILEFHFWPASLNREHSRMSAKWGRSPVLVPRFVLRAPKGPDRSKASGFKLSACKLREGINFGFASRACRSDSIAVRTFPRAKRGYLRKLSPALYEPSYDSACARELLLRELSRQASGSRSGA